jgi:hypothetical protein
MQLGRDDLILPIYFIDVPDFSSTNENKLIATIAQRQYRDWREFRHEDLRTSEAKKRIAGLASEMNEALHRAPTAKELGLNRKRKRDVRIDEVQRRIGGPFRSSRVLQELSDELNKVVHPGFPWVW